MAEPASSRNILVLDPDPSVRDLVARQLFGSGYRVTSLARPDEASEVLAGAHYDALLIGLIRGDRDGVKTVASLGQRAGGLPIMLLSDAERLQDAARCMQRGVADYVRRPPEPLELITRLERLFERSTLDSRIAFFQDQLSRKVGFRDIEAKSLAMRRVLERIQRVAPMRSTVLISGESGVGKELVARQVHLSSPRREQPFVALNCAAMPATLIESELFGHEKGAFTGAHARVRGKFEIADGGTMFLDEIGETEAATQAKLLRVLEQREFMRLGGNRSIHVDVRLIAATNADLEALVRRNRFRRDLYYRLKVVGIAVPPLRERTEDLPRLVERFLDDLARSNAVPRKEISAAALRALAGYRWPGNVRELKNLIESLLVSTSGRTIDVDDLPAAVRELSAPPTTGSVHAGTTLEQMERELIRVTLEHTGGNRTHAAELLGIGVRTLQRKIVRYGLDIPSTRRRPRSTPVR